MVIPSNDSVWGGAAVFEQAHKQNRAIMQIPATTFFSLMFVNPLATPRPASPQFAGLASMLAAADSRRSKKLCRFLLAGSQAVCYCRKTTAIRRAMEPKTMGININSAAHSGIEFAPNANSRTRKSIPPVLGENTEPQR